MKIGILKGEITKKENEITDIYKKKALELLKDEKNYNSKADFLNNNTFICKVCQKKIENPSYPNYILLWSKNGMQCVYFYLQCAFKKGTSNAFNRLLKELSYKLPF